MTEIISEGINYTLYLSVPLVLIGGLLYHFLPYSQQSRWCLSGLMLLFALALTRIILIRSGWMEDRPTTFFLPMWYTLSFGVLIFYGVKMRLYPGYRMRATDTKHFFLPIIQAIFFWWMAFKRDTYKLELLQDFIPTYYKPIEGGFFIILFFSYLALAYRYVKFKQATLRKRKRHSEAEQLEGMRRMIKVLFFLGGINTSYIISDFVAWQFMGLNLYTVKGFASLNDLSFAAMGLWLAWFAWKERKSLRKMRENV